MIVKYSDKEPSIAAFTKLLHANGSRSENRGYLEDQIRTMLAYCLLPSEVAAGKEWHACSLQTALAAIGQAIESEQVNA